MRKILYLKMTIKKAPMLNTTLRKKNKKLLSLLSLTALGLAFSQTSLATIVEFQTSQGNIQVNLFDETTPKTVENFLSYVNDAHYTNSVIHRSIPEFVIQGGGYTFDGDWPLTRLSPNAAIENEAVYSNVAGTIAMAKIGNNPDSATDQWFFNLVDNSENLDLQNNGFTVFGQIIGDESTATLNRITALNLCSAGDLTGIPMVMEEDQVCADLASAGLENFVSIVNIDTISDDPTSANDLNPLLTKYPDSDGDGVKDIYDAFPSDPDRSEAEVEEDDGGSMTWLSLCLLGLFSVRKLLRKR